MGAPVDLIKRLIAAGIEDGDLQAIIDAFDVPIPALPEPSKGALRQRQWRLKASQSVSETSQRKVSPHPSKEILSPTSSVIETSEVAPLSEVFPTRKDLDEAVSEWNDLAEMRQLPKVRELTPVRRQSLTARLRELGSLDEWVEVLVKVRDSPFCTGESGWRANFDFMMRKSSITKILEGNYDGRQAQEQNGERGTPQGDARRS